MFIVQNVCLNKIKLKFEVFERKIQEKKTRMIEIVNC